MSDEATHYERADDVECSEVPDGYVIYDHVAEQVHFLNLTAAAVFELCDGRNDAEAIAAILQDSFDLPAPPLDETQACLASLASQGLIRPGSRSSSVA